MNSRTNCPCDAIVPPKLAIHAGLANLPRQLAAFPEFRSQMLAAIGQEPALVNWRARTSDDFGVMLLEMWAYVCDCISFYDEAIANESYLRTAELRPSLRKLVALLGYLPRPAVSARVDLAVLAEGRQPITLPAGTAFKSGAFPGGTPQVFELDAANWVHPFTGKWTLARARRATLDPVSPFSITAGLTLDPIKAAVRPVPPGFSSVPLQQAGQVLSNFFAILNPGPETPDSFHSRRHFLLDPKSVRLKAGQIVLIEDLNNSANTRARTVTSVDDSPEADGVTYKKLTLSEPVPIHGNTPVANVRVATPAQTAAIWKQKLVLLLRLVNSQTGGFVDFLNTLYFDALHPRIRVGEKLILEKHGEMRWFSVAKTGEYSLELPGNAPQQPPVTWVEVDVGFNHPSRREPGSANWHKEDYASIQVHIDLRTAATPAVPADLALKPGDPMNLAPPVEPPRDGTAPSRFLLEDKDSNGEEITATINFIDRTLSLVKPVSHPLIAPVTVYGNVVSASRGETVAGEVLGSGDASGAGQTFELKKSPLSYFPALEGVVSTQKVYVDGLQWTEVPSFFGVGSDAQVYIVRQNDDGESPVTFGDGIRGRRLTTGSNNVVTYYRFGAGKGSPPAGSIHQMAKPEGHHQREKPGRRIRRG